MRASCSKPSPHLCDPSTLTRGRFRRDSSSAMNEDVLIKPLTAPAAPWRPPPSSPSGSPAARAPPACGSARLAAELAKVAAGRSDASRPPSATGASPTRRGETNRLLRRLAAGLPRRRATTVDGLVDDPRSTGAPSARRASRRGTWSTRSRRPTSRWSNPAVLKALVDNGGANLVRGARASLATSRGLPATVDTTKFEVGENLALTPGLGRPAHRGLRADPVPAADRAGARGPAAVVPPTINKYYVLDLAPGPQPGRVPVGQGQQVFVISWRNPDDAQGHFDLDTYARRGARGARRRRRDHRPDRGPPQRRLLGRASSPPGRSAISRPRAARRGREPDAAGLRARQRAGRHDVRAREPRAGRGRGRRVRPPRLPRRPGAGGRVRLAAPERPHLGLLGQQLPARQAAAGLRHPVLEPGRVRLPPACTATSSASRSTTRSRGLAARGARRAGRPGRRRRRQLHRRRARPTTSCRGRTPTGARSCSAATARFVLSTSGHIQALVNPPTPDTARATASPTSHPPTPRPGSSSGHAARQLVAGLRRLAGRALRRLARRAPSSAAQPQAAARRPAPTSTPTEGRCHAFPTQRLGSALATDYFFVREQFTGEQWEHFLATRRFVDEEVLPVINDYWERAELPWPLMRRLAELGLVGEDIQGYGCPGMSPLAAGLVDMELNRGDGSLGTFFGVQAGLAMKSIDAARLRGAEGALAAGDGAAGQDRRVRADRARPRLGLGRAGDQRAARRRRAGSSTAPSAGSATARSPTSSSSGPATTPTARSRASWWRRTRPGSAPRRWRARAPRARSGRPTIALDGVRVPEASRLPGANTFKDAGRVLVGRAARAPGGRSATPSRRTTSRWPTAGSAPSSASRWCRFQIVQDRLVKMLAEVTAMQLYCMQLARLEEAGRLSTRSPGWRSSTTPARPAG